MTSRCGLIAGSSGPFSFDDACTSIKILYLSYLFTSLIEKTSVHVADILLVAPSRTIMSFCHLFQSSLWHGGLYVQHGATDHHGQDPHIPLRHHPCGRHGSTFMTASEHGGWQREECGQFGGLVNIWRLILDGFGMSDPT